MPTLTILLTAVALSMDAVAVALGSAAAVPSIRQTHALKMALCFGIFQGVMPVIGYFFGLTVKDEIGAVDHWIAFALLSGIGGKMIYEAFRDEDGPRSKSYCDAQPANSCHGHQHRRVGGGAFVFPARCADSVGLDGDRRSHFGAVLSPQRCSGPGSVPFLLNARDALAGSS